MHGPEPNEELRLTYRFLDLRRPDMQRIFILRHRLTQLMRNVMTDLGFLDVETPILGRSTPEGARDFLVPSRVHAGHFYALPQSPQLYKQLLMVSGFDRYFQIAALLPRRGPAGQPPARVHPARRRDVVRRGLRRHDDHGIPRRRHGPGVRRRGARRCRCPGSSTTNRWNGSATTGPTSGTAWSCRTSPTSPTRPSSRSSSRRRRSVTGSEASARPGGGERYSRKDLDGLTEYAGAFGAKGLVWLKVDAEAFTGPTAKFFPKEVQAELRERFGAKAGDLILIVADTQAVTSQALSNLRARLAAELKLYDPKSFHYSWIIHFPLLAWDAEENRYVAEHHPFTMPMVEDLPLLESDPAKVRAQAYDLVVNGEECGGGTIRCHDPAIQSKIFALLGLSPEEANEKFGFLLERLPQRRPAPRRHRPGPRPADHALRRHHQHPRLHRLPQDRQGHRPHDRRPGHRRGPAAQGAAHPAGVMVFHEDVGRRLGIPPLAGDFATLFTRSGSFD